MGKEKPGFLTAKAFSNRTKSKGLQKLRWFCQVCQKQCRDENGFKCHMMAESHTRQMLLFDENRDSVVAGYTRQFMKAFLDILKRQFGGKRTLANVVYQEYIKDKTHVHMNSTKFTTLTGLVNCLHKMGVCVVDQTERGWFIEYVAKDPEAEHKERVKRRLEPSLDEEQNRFFALFKKSKTENSDDDEKKEENSKNVMLIKDEDRKITLNFERKGINKEIKSDQLQEGTSTDCDIKNLISWDMMKIKPRNNNNLFDDQKFKNEIKKFREFKTDSVKATERTLTTLEEIKVEQERLKEKNNRKNYWLHVGILVKLIDPDIPIEFQKKIAHVKSLEDRYTAIVKTVDLESGNKKMKIKQEHAMTVVPSVGERILVVNGAYRGYKAVVVSLDKKHFYAQIRLISGIHSGMELSKVDYDDISKLYEQN